MRLATGVALALLAAPAAAHDFWLQPNAFRTAAGDDVRVAVMVGDGPEAQRSAMPERRIVRFSVVGPMGERDAKGDVRAGADTRVRLPEDGAHVLVLATDEGGRSALPGDRFDAYVREQGLTPAIVAREARRGSWGSEAYGRRAKALVQAGAGGPQDAATAAVGLTLEIVPEVSPYATPAPTALPVRVFYKGQPLAGATVRLVNLGGGVEAARMVTDADGRARFSMPGRGAWRLAVVWTKPLPPTAETEFETIFSSLTFGRP